jgi:hypothetical protein
MPAESSKKLPLFPIIWNVFLSKTITPLSTYPLSPLSFFNVLIITYFTLYGWRTSKISASRYSETLRVATMPYKLKKKLLAHSFQKASIHDKTLFLKWKKHDMTIQKSSRSYKQFSGSKTNSEPCHIQTWEGLIAFVPFSCRGPYGSAPKGEMENSVQE